MNDDGNGNNTYIIDGNVSPLILILYIASILFLSKNNSTLIINGKI